MWFNPDQPGTGFTLEVQASVVSGYYYLYDEDGNPEWLMFTDALQINEDGESDARWILETDLIRVRGGACLNCSYEEPAEIETAGILKMEFYWRNHGSYSVNGGPVQRITPMAYTSSMVFGAFTPYSDFYLPSPDQREIPSLPLKPEQFPDKLPWVFVFRAQAGTGWTYGMLPVDIRSRLVENGQHEWELGALVGGEFASRWGKLTCYAEEDLGPMCRIDFDLSSTAGEIADHFVDQPLFLAPGNLGHERFEAQTENGMITLIAYRMDYN